MKMKHTNNSLVTIPQVAPALNSLHRCPCTGKGDAQETSVFWNEAPQLILFLWRMVVRVMHLPSSLQYWLSLGVFPRRWCSTTVCAFGLPSLQNQEMKEAFLCTPSSSQHSAPATEKEPREVGKATPMNPLVQTSLHHLPAEKLHFML